MHFADILADNLVPVEIKLAYCALGVQNIPISSAYIPGMNVSDKMV